ncbi:MAG: ComEC/Rec2 family competence protein [Chloroflexia bacterium]
MRGTVVWLAGCAAGVLLAASYPSGLSPLYGLALIGAGLISLVALAVAWKNPPTRWACFLLALLLLGCGRALLVHPTDTPASLAYYTTPDPATKLVVTGSVSGEPVLADRWQRLHVRADSIRSVNQKSSRAVSGDMLALLPRYPEYRTGDRLSLSGALTPPPDMPGFDYRAYLAAHSIYSYMSFPGVKILGSGDGDRGSQLIQGWRSGVGAAIQRALPEPEASLAVGVVIGDRSSMPQDLQEAFQASGTTHVLAISGENIALISGFVWLLLSGLRQRRRPTVLLTLALVASLALYTVFTGATPSVVRATAMSAVLLFAPLARRRYDPTAALAVAALVMSLLDPNVLLDAGFELSFAAMLGIVLLAPRLRDLLKRVRVPGLLAAALSTGIAAQLFTLPLSAALTGRMSLVGLPATLTVDVALLPLMISGIVTGVLGTFAPQLASITGMSAWLPAAWMIFWSRLWASLPFSIIGTGPIPTSWLASYYCALCAIVWLVTRNSSRRSWPLRSRRPLLAGLALAAALWTVLLGLVVLRF